MADVATLQINVEVKNGKAAVQEIDQVAAAGARAEKSSKALKTGLSESEQAILKQAKAAQQLQRDLKLIEQYQHGAGDAAKHAGGGFGQLNQELVTVIKNTTGMESAVAQLGYAMSNHFVASAGTMLAVLGGLAALAMAYEKITEASRKAKEEQEQLTKALEDWYDVQRRGVGGDRIKQLEAERVKIDELRQSYERLSGISGAAGFEGSFEFASIAGGKADAKGAALRTALEAAAAAQKDIDKQITESAQHQQETYVASLSASVEYFTKDAALRARAVALQKDLQAQLAYLRSAHPDDLEAQSRLVGFVQQLDRALDPDKAKRESEALREMAELARHTAEAMADLVGQLSKTNAQWTLNAAQYERIIALNKELNAGKENGYGVNVGKNTKQMADDIDRAAEAIKKAQQYTKDLQTIWRDGFAKIVTDGMKSIQDFFEDVYQMFSKLMARMEQEGKAGGLGYKLLGIGAAGVAGASAGYNSGSATTGVLSGAIAGSSFGPAGVAVGALAGLTGGLLGGAKAARERAEAEQQLRAQLEQSLNQMRVQAGAMTELAASLANAHTSAQQLREQIDKAYPGLKNQAERERLLAETRADEATIVQKLIDAEAKRLNDQSKANALDLNEFTIRQLIAQGRQDEADAMRDQLEVQRAINEGRSAEYVAALQLTQALEKAAADARKANDAFFSMADAAYQSALAARTYAFQQYQQSITDPTKEGFSDALNRQTQAFTAVYTDQIKVLRDQLKVQQDAQKTAQQSYSDTKRALDSLTSFRSSLDVGQFSVLSPAAQVAAARQQVESVFRQAQLGDKTAAGNFGGVAQSYLDVLRNYGASGSVFTSGQADIAKMADALVTQYGVQATIDQQMLASATQQVDLLTQQVDLAQRQIDAIDAAAKEITKVYDRLSGAGGVGTIAGVWDSVVFSALSSALGGAPGGLTNSNPLAIGPNGLPFGNTSASGSASLAERFVYAFQQFLASQSTSAASPAAQVEATEENTDVLRAGFDELSDSVDRIAAATEANAEQIKQLVRTIGKVA